MTPHRKRPLRTRVTTESAKLARRASLVLTARSLFASRDFQDDEIAVFRLNFRAELESALATLFAEAQGRLGRPSPKSGSVEAFPQCTFHLHWRPATPPAQLPI